MLTFHIHCESNHKITEWLGLERACKGHLVQGHLTRDQVTQSLVQPFFKHFQGWISHNFPGQFVPVPHHPHGKEFLPNIYSESSLFECKTLPLILSLLSIIDSLPIFPLGPL